MSDPKERLFTTDPLPGTITPKKARYEIFEDIYHV